MAVEGGLVTALVALGRGIHRPVTLGPPPCALFVGFEKSNMVTKKVYEW